MDGGLDAFNSNLFTNLFGTAIAGTGTTPTSRASSPITITQAGNQITSSAAFFQAGDVGRIIKYGGTGSGSGGAQYYITAFTSTTVVTVSGSATVTTPALCIIWYVNQTTMATPVKTTNVYPATGNGSVLTPSAGTLTVAHTRIYIFSAEVSAITYQEIGWSWNGTNIFGRDLITPAGVAIAIGQQLEVTINVTLIASPTNVGAVVDVSGGTWNTAGTALIEYFRTQTSGTFGSNAFSTIGAAGGTVGCCMEPAGSPAIGVVSGAWTQLTSISTGANGNGNAFVFNNTTQGTYTNGTFTNTFGMTWTISQAVGGPYTGIVIGNGSAGWIWSNQLTTPNSKDASHNLSFTFTFVWNRILSN